MKKITSLLITLSMVLSVIFTGCAKQEIVSREIRIGVTVYDEYDTFVSQMMESFNAYVAEEMLKSDVSISVLSYSAERNQSTQNEQVAEMISKGCNVICVNLVDRTDTSTILSLAREADVPVVFFNRELVQEDLMSWDKLYYVGGNAYESGEMQGHIAAQACMNNSGIDRNGDGVIQTVVIEGEPGHQDAIVRTENSLATVEEDGVEIELLDSVIANWNRAQAQNKMSQLIDKYNDQIELVLSNNDDMALGAISEYDSRSIAMSDRPLIIGIDGTDVGIKAIIDGKMFGTVYNDKEGQAKALLEIALAAVDGEDIANVGLTDGKYIRLPYAPVTMENVFEYYKDNEDVNGGEN